MTAEAAVEAYLPTLPTAPPAPRPWCTLEQAIEASIRARCAWTGPAPWTCARCAAVFPGEGSASLLDHIVESVQDPVNSACQAPQADDDA